jgi:hypothetical protein
MLKKSFIAVLMDIKAINKLKTFFNQIKRGNTFAIPVIL